MVGILAKILGFLRDVSLAHFYGSNYITDAYIVASTIPTQLFYFLGHAIATSFIPMYTSIKSKYGRKKADEYSNKIITISTLFAFLLFSFCFFNADLVIRIFASGFSKESFELAVELLKLCSISFLFYTYTWIFTAYLQIYNRFVVTSMISIPLNIVLITSIPISYYFGVYFLGIGITMGTILQFLLLIPSIRKTEYRFRLDFVFNTKELKETIHIVLPVFLSVAVDRINNIVDKNIASTIMIGAITIINYASVINSSIQQILITSLISILYAKISSYVSNDEKEKVVSTIIRAFRMMIFILLPATFGIILLSYPVINMFYGRGSLDSNSILITSNCLSIYSISILFCSMRDLLIKIFYSYKKTRITFFNSIISVSVNIVLNVILSYFFGIYGLIVATVCASIVAYCLLLIQLKKIVAINYQKIISFAFKILLMSVIMYFLCAITKNMLLDCVSNFILIITIALEGTLIYILLAKLLKIKEMEQVFYLIKRKL